ncbi:SurA N-terminal domain-containing protein, partial [Elusimicrobiota bacterium]
DEIIQQKKQEVIQQLIQEEVFWQEAKKYGITVSDTELTNDIRNYPAFQRNGRFDHITYYKIMNNVLRTTPKEFEASRRKQIAAYRLRQLIASNIKITEPEIQMQYSRENKGKMSNYEKEKAEFAEKIRQEKTMLIYDEWFKNLNQNMKIKVHLDEIERVAK